MIGDIPLKISGNKTRVVINRERLVVARVRYFDFHSHVTSSFAHLEKKETLSKKIYLCTYIHSFLSIHTAI